MKIKLRGKLQASQQKSDNESKSTCENASAEAIQAAENSIQVRQEIVNTWGTYAGEPDKWYEFKKNFTKSVVENEALEPSEKLRHFKEACKNAYMLYSDTSDFDSAWDKICEIYGCVYTITQFCMRKILTTQKMHEASCNAIKNLLEQTNECEVLLGQANQLSNFDAFLALNTIDKMDAQTQRVWERHRMILAESWALKSKDEAEPMSKENFLVTWSEVKNFLKSEMDIHAIQSTSYAQAAKQTSSSKQTMVSEYRQATSDLATTRKYSTEKSKQAKFLQCVLCEATHPLFKCEKFKSMIFENKCLHVIEHNLCGKCLRPKHGNANCEDESCNKQCPACYPDTVYHNSLICPKKQNKPVARTNPVPPAKRNWNNDDDWEF